VLDALSETTSTNILAARLPAWHAVRADTQTDGRGRTGRHWTSDTGGLWLSAVVPCPGPRENWARLPLAVGWALLDTLASLGAVDLRLRWPNDILAGSRKLAGLLVERHTPDTAVVGIGLNVFNHPESDDATLRGATARLADLVALGDRNLDDIAALVLCAVARAHQTLCHEGFSPIAAALNDRWSQPRLVALTLADQTQPVLGNFLGIDPAGNLILRARDGSTRTFDAHRVALLRELAA
jgi:BirA family biotin operon repressor/biotin-[acetyl-CoA-carboxylase] ligase